MQDIEDVERKNQILDSALAFASYLVGKYPQVNENGQVNYSFAGSLATMLFARAESIDIIDPRKSANSLENAIQVPIKTRDILSNFARQIGDVDVATTSGYESQFEVSVDEVPENTVSVLQIVPWSNLVIFDHVEIYGEDRIAKMEVHGKSILISEPKQILAYQVLHALQNFGHKYEKILNDFPLIYNAIKEIYDDNDLISSAHNVLTGYQNRISNLIGSLPQSNLTRFTNVDELYRKRLENHPLFDGELRSFVEKVIEFDSKQERRLFSI